MELEEGVNMTKTVRNSQRTNKTTIERKIEYLAVSATPTQPPEILYGAQKAPTSPIGALVLRRAKQTNGNPDSLWELPACVGHSRHLKGN